MPILRLTLLFLCITGLAKCERIRAAPYYMPLDNGGQELDIERVMKETGVKQFILVFILAPSAGGCVPTWGGNASQKVASDELVLKKVKAIRSAGGDVSVSFGGYTGVELGHVCGDTSSLANAYQEVIDKYSLTNIDFDIENTNLGDIDGENRRFKAIQILKQRNKDLFVSLTLPSTTVGLSDLGRDEIKRAIDDGVTIDLYKVMAFDYGGPATDQVNSVIGVMEASHKQLKALRTDLNDAQVYAATGLILMNGHTDQPSELYSIHTFKQLIAYANQKSLGRVPYWALNRDRPCTKQTGWVSGECSSLPQQVWDFTKTLAAFH